MQLSTQCNPKLPQKEQDLEEIVLIPVSPKLEKITFCRLWFSCLESEDKSEASTSFMAPSGTMVPCFQGKEAANNPTHLEHLYIMTTSIV